MAFFVVATDVADEFPIEIFNRDEDAASDYISLDLENRISTWLSQEE